MHTAMKILIIFGISVVILPLSAAFRETHLNLLYIPLICGYIAAVSAVWRWQPKGKRTENALDLDKTK